MKSSTFLILMVLLSGGCEAPRRPGSESEYRLVSICGLYRTAANDGLWGQKVRIAGHFMTDNQTYGWIRQDCDPRDSNGIEFTRLVNLDGPGLELMKAGYAQACRDPGFCVVSAQIEVEGTLVHDPDSDYQMLIKPSRILKFDLVPGAE